MKVGQKLKVLEIGKDYFGPKYANTEVEVVEIYPDGGTLVVRCFDGKECVSPRSYVGPAKIVDFPPIPDIITSDTKCQHPNKRWTVISGTLKYWYCPECKEEVR